MQRESLLAHPPAAQRRNMNVLIKVVRLMAIPFVCKVFVLAAQTLAAVDLTVAS